MATNPAKKIYISYTHKGEGKQITDALDKAFQGRDVLIERDIRNVEYKGSFSEFTKQLGTGDYVIAVIDKPYLESHNCMEELMEVYKNEQFRERIFPVVLQDAKIYKPLERLKYIKFWSKEIKELDDAMREMDNLSNMGSIQKDLDLYTEIRHTFDRIIEILADMNVFKLKSHQEEKFKTVFDEIHGKISKNDDTILPPTLEGKALIQHLIAQGDTTTAIQEFLNIASTSNQQNLHNDLILLSGRNNSNEKDYDGGTLSRENYEIAKARIAKSLNSLLS